MQLCQFSCDDGFTLAEYLVSVFKCGGEAMRPFIEDQRARHRLQLCQPSTTCGCSRRQKACKEKLVSGQSRCNQCCDQRAWARDGNDYDFILDRCADKSISGIAD